MGETELQKAVAYRAEKCLDEAVTDAAEGTAERFRAGGHEAMAYDEVIVVDGQAVRITYEVKPVTPEEVLRELAAEVKGDAEDEAATDLAIFLRRSAYEGRLRGVRSHLVC